MKKIFAVFAATALANATLVNAAIAAPPAHTRGTLLAATGTMLTVRTPAGTTVSFALTPATHYAAVSRGSLTDVRAGKFIGTATKAVGGKAVALEVAVFPEAMRGAGEGHYPWDEITDTTAPGAGMAASSMTNGNVSAAMPAPKTASTMTNGNVSTAGAAGGGMTLTVTYRGGAQRVTVPAGTPVVTIAPAQATVLRPGASVMVFSRMVTGKPTAVAVSAGVDGLRLPM